MESRPFGGDAATGTVETFHFDHATDTLIIETTQDVEPIIEENKLFMCDAGSGWKGDTHRIASIPLNLLPTLEKLHIMDRGGRILDHKRLRKWLNDRDNLAFRTRPGVI